MVIELKSKNDSTLSQDLDALRTKLQEVLYELTVVSRQLNGKRRELETRNALMVAPDSESASLAREIKDLDVAQGMLATQAAKIKGDIQKAISNYSGLQK